MKFGTLTFLIMVIFGVLPSAAQCRGPIRVPRMPGDPFNPLVEATVADDA